MRRMKKVTLTLLLAACTIWLLNALVHWGKCGYYGYETGRDTRYAAFLGCMVSTPSGWVPRSELRVVQ